MTNCVINKHQAQCIDCIPKKVSTAKRPAKNTNIGTCHSEDYIACALVIAGCTAGDCSGKVTKGAFCCNEMLIRQC